MGKNNVKHILRYGTNAEKKYIDNKDTYFDLLAFNGNMFAYTPGAIAKFIMMNLLDSGSNKGFFIDPITHAFQHDLSKIKSYSEKENKKTIKKSILNLIENYGDPIKSIVINKKRSIMPKDFNSGINQEFCQNVINFQLNTTRERMKDKGFLEYIPEDAPMLENLEPDFIIPPYFYMTESTVDDWLPLNIDFLNIARSIVSNKDIYAQVVLSQDIFSSDDFFEIICKQYKIAKPDGILLWIDDFNEHEASKSQLKKYVRLIKEFSATGIKVFNLYGGFFSIALTGFKKELGYNLDGVGHGLEYGEHRSVIPVGGGIPTSRYYYYPLHRRLRYREATELLEAQGYFNMSPKEGAKKYYDELCDCKLCHEKIKDNINNFSIFENTKFYEVEIRGVKQRRNYSDQETKEACLIHYLWNKKREFDMVEKQPLTRLTENIINIYETYLDMGVLNWESLIYLKNWADVLNEEKGVE